MLLQGNSSSIAQKSSEIWTVQADLQPIPFKSDRLLAPINRSTSLNSCCWWTPSTMRPVARSYTALRVQ